MSDAKMQLLDVGKCLMLLAAASLVGLHQQRAVKRLTGNFGSHSLLQILN
jgi:hypothetical protein